MSAVARGDSAATKAVVPTSPWRSGAERAGEGKAARLGREGLAVGVAVILVFNPWVEALPVPSRPGATAHRAALPAPPGDLPTTRVDPSALPQAGAASAVRLKEAVRKLPLYFIENRGQADPRVAYYVQGAGTSVYFSRAGITFALTSPAKSEAGTAAAPTGEARPAPPASARERWAVKLDFLGANPDAKPAGEDRTEAVVSYFKGDRADWKTGLPTYGRVVYTNLWPGIDLVYTGAGGRLKYTFVVRPGADPKRIRLAYRGGTAVGVSGEGRLSVSTPVGPLVEDTPYVYQEAGADRVQVEAAYALEAEEAGGTRRFGFRVGPYDPGKPLFLDPVVLAYCGFIGGSAGEAANAVAVDGSGNAYVTGNTGSSEASFPVAVGPDLTYNGGFGGDAFVAKVNAAGTALVYCGYIGGSGGDFGNGVAVDNSGNAYVTGYTSSTQATFPVIVGPDLTYRAANDAFVAKVKADGTGLVYCGYIGGSGGDFGQGIAVDGSGNAYVVGYTDSTAASFPETVGPDLTFNGSTDAFVAKVNAAGTALVYCGYIGGSGIDIAYGVAVDTAGNAYVTGYTLSSEATFPVAVGPDLTFKGGNDAFVAKVNAAGTALVYCGYIGGSGDERGFGVAVDTAGNAYVTGQTTSTEATFPVTVGPDLTLNGGIDAFVTKVGAVATAVDLLSFEALPLDSGVELRWETGSELNNLGFSLYRSLSAEGPYERITSTVIPGLGSSPAGASYSYVDGGLANGTTYFYKLEDIETTGKTRLHGPVSAVPQTSSSTSGGDGVPGDGVSGSSTGGSTTKTAYGDPSSMSLRVLESDEHHALVELWTGGFYAVRQADGSVQLEIPGMEEVLDPGLPALPVKRAFVEAVVGRGVRLGAAVAHDVMSFPDLRPALSGSPEMVVSRDGVARARVRRARVARPLEPGLFPVRVAQLLGTAFQGEIKKAVVELWPLRWDSSSNRLELARRLVVRLEFAGKEEGESSRGGLSRGRRVPPRLDRSADELLAQLVVRQTGLYAVRFEELFPSRRRSLQVSELRLSRQGETVAFHLEPDGSSFGPASALYFFSQGASLNPYGNEAVYELSLSRRGGVTMPLVSAFPSGSATSFAWSLKRWEENRTFQPGLLEAPDLWLWDILIAPVKKSHSFALESLVSTSEPSQLTVFLQGGSDQEGVDDHHVRVWVNGSAVAEASWDGTSPKAVPASIGPGILREGDNLLELESLGDAGASYSLVFLDRFELVYPRSLSASAGQFEARFSLSGSAEVSGLGADSLLVDTTSPTEPRWLFGASPTQTGIAFRTEAERQYLALSPQNLLHPQVRLPIPSSLHSTITAPTTCCSPPRPSLPPRSPFST